MVWVGAVDASGYIQLVSSSFFARVSAVVDLDDRIAIRLPYPAEVALVRYMSVEWESSVTG